MEHGQLGCFWCVPRIKLCELVESIAKHNTGVIGAKVCRYQGQAACEAFGSGKKKVNVTAAVFVPQHQS